MKILLELEKKKLNETLNKVRSFQEDFLRWTVNEQTPAENPEEILWYLKTFDELDKLIIGLIKKMNENENSKQQ